MNGPGWPCLLTNCNDRSDIVTSMQAGAGHLEEWANVDVHQRIRQFQTRIDKMDTLTAPAKEDNNNSPEGLNRNIQKTRSKSLPSKYLLLKDDNSEPETLEREEVKLEEEDPGAATVTFHSDEEDQKYQYSSRENSSSNFCVRSKKLF